MENKKGTGNVLKVRLNSVKGDLGYIDVFSIVNFSCFASVKENVAACKAKPTSNLKDIILIPFYCICIGVLVNIQLDISGKLFSDYLNVQQFNNFL